jgi:hypothetical protein
MIHSSHLSLSHLSSSRSTITINAFLSFPSFSFGSPQVLDDQREGESKNETQVARKRINGRSWVIEKGEGVLRRKKKA